MPPFFVGAGQFSPVSGAGRGGRRRARKARPPVRRPRPADGLVLRAQPAKPPPPRPRASTCVGGGAYPKRQARPLRPSAFPCNQQPATDNPICVHPRWQLPPCTPEPCGGRRRARKARPPVRRPRPADGLVLRAQPAKPPPPRPRASTCVGGGAYPKSHRVKLLPQNAKKWPTATFLQCAILR